MSHYAVIAIGADRPGIVAALTGALFDIGANLEDFASSILRGHFAIMLVADVPAGVSADSLQGTMEGAAGPLGVSVTVRDVEAGAPRRATGTHSLVAYAADRPGIVAGLAGVLARRGVNVTDLSCRLTTEEPPLYVMVAELAVPQAAEAGLSEEIASTARDLGVDVSFRTLDADTL